MALICTQSDMDKIKNDYWRSQFVVVPDAVVAAAKAEVEEAIQNALRKAERKNP